MDSFGACEVFLARLKLAQGDVAGAAAILAEADQFVRQYDYVYQMPEVAALQVRTLLQQGNPAAAAGTERPQPELLEPLSERELEVLLLVADGLTNPEIASRLYLWLNTIKVHTRNIYGKLGVHNRTQAVARGRALRVLPSI